MATIHEISVPNLAQLNLDSTTTNHQTVWEEIIETMGVYFIYFIAMDITETKKRRFFFIRVDLN